MNAQLDIRHNILDQFARQLRIPAKNDQLHIESDLVQGSIYLTPLPNNIELYHFSFTLKTPFEIHSINPEGSDWLLININLSESVLEKTVNNQEMNFQKYLPSGMLFYTPKTEVFSVSPPHTPFSIVLIRFHKSLLEQYSGHEFQSFQGTNSAILYEDLDFQSEQLLTKSLQKETNPLLLHAYILQFLGHFFGKLKNRDQASNYQKLHPDDLKGLFTASAFLRNPFDQNPPSVEELSKIAGMGTTKFNTTFKQVFGTTPLQYHLKIRMEHAKDQLARNMASPSEISYRLGYSHPSKFTAAFKKQFGCLPSEI